MTQQQLHTFLMGIEALLCDTKYEPKDLLAIHLEVMKHFKKSKKYKRMTKAQRSKYIDYRLKLHLFYQGMDGAF